MNRYIITIFLALLLIIIGSFVSIQLYLGFHANASENNTENFEYYYNNIKTSEDLMISSTGTYPTTASSISSETINEIEEADKILKQEKEKTRKKKQEEIHEIDTTPGSYQQLINRDYELSSDYYPDDLTEPDVRFSFNGSYEKRKLRQKASDALEELFAAAEEDGYILYGISGFRSYERQSEIYNRNLSVKGTKHTNLYSAMPGTSEHQSGLAIDVSSHSANLQLLENFGTTEEGKWLVKNCWKYGFILRYPEDKVEITKYAYEPWHIRYVGKKLAKYLYKHDLCLEEYYGYKAPKKNS